MRTPYVFATFGLLLSVSAGTVEARRLTPDERYKARRQLVDEALKEDPSQLEPYLKVEQGKLYYLSGQMQFQRPANPLGYSLEAMFLTDLGKRNGVAQNDASMRAMDAYARKMCERTQ